MAAIARVCRECRRDFTITDDEQDALRDIAVRADWAIVILPTRCLPCRQARRRERRQAGADRAMGSYR